MARVPKQGMKGRDTPVPQSSGDSTRLDPTTHVHTPATAPMGIHFLVAKLTLSAQL